MPSESHVPAVPEHTRSDQTQLQAKTCFRCHSPLQDLTSTAFFLHENSGVNVVNDASLVCGMCQERNATAVGGPQLAGEQFSYHSVDRDGRLVVPEIFGNETSTVVNLRRTIDHHLVDRDIEMESSESSSSCSDSDVPYRRPQSLSLTPPLPSHTTKRSRLTCDTSAPSTSLQPTQRPSTYIKQQAREIRSPFSHDPLVDITRLRVRSQGCHCLYPGAVFQGTQKSGRNSYDVTVNIVDVDFSSSSLCGYLCIRGLTDDWPELTTYFDAEIIGSRYGFRTQDWSATEQDDLSHWSCFPAFKHVKPELQKPSWTVPDRDRGAVFMRWKERFLVPDHRVQDISGASFAGFYYVCVDFNPQAHQSPLRTVSEQLPLSSGEDAGSCPAKTEPPIRPQRRESRDFDRSTSARRSSSRSWSPSRPTTATMSGYYFHQNSEPYQQLSLSHVAQHTASSFEFR